MDCLDFFPKQVKFQLLSTIAQLFDANNPSTFKDQVSKAENVQSDISFLFEQ